jgi:hypothetical protein
MLGIGESEGDNTKKDADDERLTMATRGWVYRGLERR